MSFNIFNWIIGNPVNTRANRQYDSALKALKAARARHDLAAERKALAQMRAASKAAQKTAQHAISASDKIAQATTSSKSNLKTAGLLAGALVVALVGYKVLKS